MAEGSVHTQGSVPGWVRCRKRNQIIGLKEDKDPEELPDINDPFTSLLLTRRDAHTLPLWVCVSVSFLS